MGSPNIALKLPAVSVWTVGFGVESVGRIGTSGYTEKCVLKISLEYKSVFSRAGYMLMQRFQKEIA